MKKILALLTALMLLLSMTACGGGNNVDTPTGGEQPPNSSQQQEPDASEPGVDEPGTDEPIGSAGNISISTASIDGYDLPEAALAYVGTFNKAYNDLYNDGEITFYVKSKDANEDAFDALIAYYASNGGTLDEGASTSATKCFDFPWGRIEVSHFGVDEEISAYIILPEYPVTGNTDDPSNGDPIDLSGFLSTKVGKFYSRFADGRMYMEYEMEMEGQVMTMISATNGSRTYSETKINGVSMGVNIMDGDVMYTIDHASKMVIKMSPQANAQIVSGAVLEEIDVDMADFKTGTREIDGKTYDTEELIVDGGAAIYCFDGDDLVYIIGAFEGEEMVMKIVEVSDSVDDSLFEIPEDYTVMEF